MRLDVPKFSGLNPESWIFAINEYFSLLNTPADQCLRIMGFNLEGAAAEWFRWMTRNGLITTLARFEESAKTRFGPSKYKDPQGALSKLLQLGMVEDYQREFEKLMNRVTDISDSLLIFFYISGLKLNLQRELLVSKPTTLGDVFLLARITEARFEAIAHKEKATTEKEDKKAHTRVHELDKQVEKLPMELQLKNNFREALETRSLDLKKKMLDLNPALHDLQKVVVDDIKKRYKTKRTLKIDDEEFKKAKSEATTKIRKLTEV
ncbi:ty3-gypsy retrotransposon protein [Tanacetum coccineum]